MSDPTPVAPEPVAPVPVAPEPAPEQVAAPAPQEEGLFGGILPPPILPPPILPPPILPPPIFPPFPPLPTVTVGGAEQDYIGRQLVPVAVAEQMLEDQQAELENYQAIQREPLPPQVPPQQG
jgi:hypothetical protein